jgi:anaphase-promoting complex subunit 4
LNTSKVLTYIERYLTSSPLDVFFAEVSKEDWQADLDYIEDGVSLLPILDTQLKKQEAGQPSRKALQQVGFLVSYVTSWSSRMFKDIAEAKKRSVRFGNPLKLSIGQPVSSMDIRMCRASRNVSQASHFSSPE